MEYHSYEFPLNFENNPTMLHFPVRRIVDYQLRFILYFTHYRDKNTRQNS